MSIAAALSKGLASVTRDHYKEKKRQERGRTVSYRAWREPRPVLKDAVFAAMPEAITRASGGGGLPFTVRQLYYQIRPLIAGSMDRELEYAYFTPPLVTEYEEDHGPIPGLLYDARGNLREPHTGKVVPLGTQGIGSYDLPAWAFNKVLYVEKEGFTGVFEAAKMAERYDLAIMGGKGYATRAAKELAARAAYGGCTVLVLHDCDHDGYEIGRTLAEVTRTSWHTIDVIDIGLSVADVTSMGLATEGVSMRKRPSWEFRARLTPDEQEFFLTNRLRTEINAMSSDQLIDFVEAKLKEHGLTEKVLPPENIAVQRFKDSSKEHLEPAAKGLVHQTLQEVLGLTLDDLNEQALELLLKGYGAGKGYYKRMARDLNNGQREKSWRAYTADKAERRSKQRVREKKADVLAVLARKLKDGQP